MAYFHCLIGGGSSGGGYTLTVTCDSDFASSTITCTDGVTTLTQTCPSASPYEVVFAIPNGGTWTVSGTISGSTFTASIDIPDELELYSTPDGSTVTPTDDIQTWLECARIRDKSYTTLNEVLADSTTLLALISDDNASDYLVRSTTWASGITADSTAMTDIGANDYCAETLLADSTWCAAICNSTYFESVLDVKVPTMTSNTTPSGECFGSGSFNSSYYNAFDGVITMAAGWASQDNSNDKYVGYEFTTNVNVKKILLSTPASANNNELKTFKIQYYNSDTSTWVDASEILTYMTATQTTAFSKSFVLDTDGSSTKWRLFALSNIAGNNLIRICEAQLYGHGLSS